MVMTRMMRVVRWTRMAESLRAPSLSKMEPPTRASGSTT